MACDDNPTICLIKNAAFYLPKAFKTTAANIES